MADTILTIVRSWGVGPQFAFLVIVASLLTLIVLPLINGVSTFFTETLPILVRGWPQGTEVTIEDESEEKDEDEES